MSFFSPCSRASVTASGCFFVYQPEFEKNVTEGQVLHLRIQNPTTGVSHYYWSQSQRSDQGPQAGPWALFCILHPTQSPSSSSSHHHQVKFGLCSNCTVNFQFYHPPFYMQQCYVLVIC